MLEVTTFAIQSSTQKVFKATRVWVLDRNFCGFNNRHNHRLNRRRSWDLQMHLIRKLLKYHSRSWWLVCLSSFWNLNFTENEENFKKIMLFQCTRLNWIKTSQLFFFSAFNAFLHLSTFAIAYNHQYLIFANCKTFFSLFYSFLSARKVAVLKLLLTT